MKEKNTAGAWLYRHTRRQLSGVLVLALLETALALAYIWLALLSKELLGAAQTLLESTAVHTLWDCLRQPILYRPALTVVAVVIGQVVLYATISHWRVYLAGKVEIALQKRVFASLLRADYATVHTHHSGELLTQLTSDVTVVSNSLVGLLPSAASMVARLVGCITVMTMLAPQLTLVMIAVGILGIVCSRWYGSRLKQLHKWCQEANGKTRSFMQEMVSHLLFIKAFDNQEAVEEQLDDRQQVYLWRKLRRNRLQVLGSSGLYMIMTAAYYVVLVWCVFGLVMGTMTVGALTALLQIVSQLQVPLRGASGLLTQYYAMMASAERLYQTDSLPAEPKPCLPADSRLLAQGFRQLTLSDVSFAYDDDTPVLQDVTLTVRRGECVALVGASGIGKSTLMKLILAIHPCTAGEITLEGEVSVPASAATRCLMAYVPQGNPLIAGTLRQNIAFFRPVAEERLNEALRLACLDDFVATLPQGLDTLVGENGFGVSEGQAQRIGIARAVLHNAPILLLDECTSALDAATEEQLLNNLRTLRDRAVLLISHKNTTVAGCESVWRLENGRLHAV